MPSRRLWALLALLPALAACGDGGATSSRKVHPELWVGVILPMTDRQATFGEESWNGMLLAEEDLRKDASKSVPFKLILKDEKSSKQEAANQAKLLIDKEEVNVLIGSVASSITKQIAQEAREASVPLITPASTNDTVTTEGGTAAAYVSRICFKDSFQGTLLAQFSLERGWRRAALVIDKANAYSTGLARNFEESFVPAGGTVTKDYFSEGDKEFSNVIESVASRKPDVVFIAGYYAEAGPMIRQSRGKWDGLPIIGGDGFDSPELIPLAGDTKANIFLTTHFAADAPDPKVQAFATRYRERFGKMPGAMAALGYDVLFVLMDAAKRAKDPYDRAELAKAIRETKGIQGITGTLDLTTPDRTPVKEAVIVRVDGGLKHVATIKPK